MKAIPRQIEYIISALLCCVLLNVSPSVLGSGISLVNSPRRGLWLAWLDSPGGALSFDLRVAFGGSPYLVSVINGSMETQIPVVTFDGRTLTMGFDYYDSWIEAKVSDDGSRMDGEWKKKGRDDKWNTMRFHAVSRDSLKPDSPILRNPARCGTAETGGIVPLPPLLDEHIFRIHDHRWRVKFSSSEQPAVGVFECGDDDRITGTFLTVGGDYGHLNVSSSENAFQFTSFDGGHAFLFKARFSPEDWSLEGDFWSGPSWHETWTAKRDENAELPDAFSLTKAMGRVDLEALKFPDVDGKVHSLADPEFKGGAIVIEVFGSWRPNCHDASTVLMELYKKYADAAYRWSAWPLN